MRLVKSSISALLVSILFWGCGPNAQEQAETQRKRDDSIKLATEQLMQSKFEKEELQKQALQEVKSQIAKLKSQVDEAKGTLAGLVTKLENDKKFKVGRSPKEKEETIANDVHNIAKVERFIEETNEKINELENSLEQ